MDSLIDRNQSYEHGKQRPRSDRSEGGVHLLFVCTGNTCRSPMAEGIAAKMLEDLGRHDIVVSSAGVAASPGSASDGTVRVSANHGIDVSGHRTTQLTPELVDWADLILTMTEGHRGVVEALGGAGKVALLTAFGGATEERVELDPGVVDPIGGDDTVYEETFQQLRTLIRRSLERLAPAESR